MPNPRGIYCPDCRGVRLHVYGLKRPVAGMVRRYRRCTACGAKVITEERQKLAPTKTVIPADPTAT